MSMPYYSTQNGHNVTSAPWGEYEEYIEGLRIKKGITEVGGQAFYGLYSMKSRTASIQSRPGFFCMQARSNFAGKFGCTSTKREIIIKPEIAITRRRISVYTKKKKI